MRATCGVKLVSSKQTKANGDQLYGHVVIKGENNVLRKVKDCKIKGTRERGKLG